MSQNPHEGAPVLHAGAPLAQARAAVVLLHGRGGSAANMLELAQEFGVEGIAWLAPQAAGNTWYPMSFLAPRQVNEPWASSALRLVERTVEQAVLDGVARERVVLCGFSQGACLASEFVASHPARYGGLIAYTGGLLGPPGAALDHAGELAGMPVLLTGGDADPHVPWERVEQTAEVLRRMHASVEAVLYRGRPHTITPDEVRRGRELIAGAAR